MLVLSGHDLTPFTTHLWEEIPVLNLPFRSAAWAVLLLLGPGGQARAQGSGDPAINLPICTDPNNQLGVSIASDGGGGAILTWQDNRNGTYDIYAQRVSATGVAQWTANGVVVCAAASEQYAPTIVSDGAGGAIITWQDNRHGNFDI